MSNPYILLEGMISTAKLLKISIDRITQPNIEPFLNKINELIELLDDISDKAQITAEENSEAKKSTNKNFDKM